MRRVHFIGIGGVGMSGMAQIFCEQGCSVSGSDHNLQSPRCQNLRNRGVKLYQGNQKENVPIQANLVVYSAAIQQDNPELQWARTMGLLCFPYSEILGKLMDSKNSIAVAGTHGKTTTTGILTSILKAGGKDPGYLIGGEMEDWGGNGHWGEGKAFVAEACEFNRSFHDLRPQHAILTNIEKDHLDYYKDLGEIQDAFRLFLSRLPYGALVTYSKECSASKEVLEGLGLRTICCGLSRDRETEIWADNIRYLKGGTQFEVYCRGNLEGTLITRLLGAHNVKNILAAYGLARAFRISFDDIAKGVSLFKGVARRFEEIGEARGVTILDDYAHHPSEIQAVLSAIKQRYPDRRLFLVFQPHQYSRTYQLLGQFAMTLADADQVILPEIYAARDTEEEKERINSFRLCKEINLLGGNARFIPGFHDIGNHLFRTCKKGDVVMTMGAGNINQVAYLLLDYLGGKQSKSA